MIIFGRQAEDDVYLTIPGYPNKIRIKILSGNCRLGIDAPAEIKVNRGEIEYPTVIRAGYTQIFNRVSGMGDVDENLVPVEAGLDPMVNVFFGLKLV